MSRGAFSGHPLAEPQLEPETFESLADLFLGEDLDRDDAPRTIERRAVIVGHLPVAAAAWVSQHARDLARASGGAVAVVTRAAGHVTLDLIGSERQELRSDLGEAVRAAIESGVRAWLVRTDAVGEIELAEHPAIDGFAVLTGADEIATVGAYRAIKGLLAGPLGQDGEHPNIHLAIMGADEQSGRPAAERLRRAVESFLQTGLASVGITQRIDSAPSSRLFDGPSELDVGGLLEMLPSEVQPARQAAAPLRIAHGDQPVASRIGPVAAISEPRGRIHAPALPDTLAPLLGLVPIEPRCPYADEVEIAVDAEGRAHVIVHAEGPAHSLAGALESVEIARAWLGAHLTLLSAATGGKVRATPPLDPATHIVVDHAGGARRLLDGAARVYVLARGRAETLCISLN
jgi:hypothetical protein